MGYRANFVVLENGDWQLYYAHWVGYRMLDVLLGGPKPALRYVTSLIRDPKTQWLDPAWADGGAVIDLDRRRLLFFGDELMTTMNERRAMLAALAIMWDDYAVGWAYDGLVELAGYVGAETHTCSSPLIPRTRLARERGKLCQVVSVVDPAGGLRLWPLRWTISQAWHGPALLDKLPGPGLSRLTLGMIPEGGVHIDVDRNTVGQWHTADNMGICTALPGLWPGWQTDSWRDGFEQQVQRCGTALRLPVLDLAAGAHSARSWISQRLRGGGVSSGWDEWRRFAAACDEVRGPHAASA